MILKRKLNSSLVNELFLVKIAIESLIINTTIFHFHHT